MLATSGRNGFYGKDEDLYVGKIRMKVKDHTTSPNVGIAEYDPIRRDRLDHNCALPRASAGLHVGTARITVPDFCTGHGHWTDVARKQKRTGGLDEMNQRVEPNPSTPHLHNAPDDTLIHFSMSPLFPHPYLLPPDTKP